MAAAAAGVCPKNRPRFKVHFGTDNWTKARRVYVYICSIDMCVCVCVCARARARVYMYTRYDAA